MMYSLVYNNRIYRVIFRQIPFFLSLFYLSCSLDIPYENQFSDPDAVSTPEKARELLATAYALLPDASFELSMLSDDFEPTELLSKNVGLKELYEWAPLPVEHLALSLWQGYYAAVGGANAVLERVRLLSGHTPGEKEVITGIIAEAHVLKAYSFFNLLRLFAPDYSDGNEREGIPLKSKLEQESLPRATVKVCADTIRTLLMQALASNYESRNEYWFSPRSAYYILAELELYTSNFDKAAAYALEVIRRQGGYGVLDKETYRKLWGDSECRERIFSWFNPNPYYRDINMTRGLGDYVRVNPSLSSLYDEGDVRKEASVFSCPFVSNKKNAELCFGKYNKENKEGRVFHTVCRQRVSGACFILAEAYCRMGKAFEPKAVEVMNEYLKRRTAALLPETGGELLLQSILQEKRKEFVGEGERYFDLKRLRKNLMSGWNKSGTMTLKKIGTDDYRWNFPIPSKEYLYNRNMNQNEGWSEIIQ